MQEDRTWNDLEDNLTTRFVYKGQIMVGWGLAMCPGKPGQDMSAPKECKGEEGGRSPGHEIP